MPNLSIAANASPWLSHRHLAPRAHTARRRQSVRKLPYALFLLLVAFSILNVGTIYTYIFGSEFPVNPIMFAILAVPIFVLTRGGKNVGYFKIAWLFWVIYALGGFLGPHQITTLYFYGTLQAIFKIWISLIGIPWLAVRVIKKEMLPRYTQITCILIAAGSLLAVVQLFDPSVLAEATTGGGRGAGLWINPNLCSALCAVGLLFSLMFPFRWLLGNYILRIVLVCGLAATLSRAGILASLIALVVFGLLAGRWTATLRALCVTVFLGIGAIFALEPLKQSHIPGLAQRVEGIQHMLMGGVRAQTMKGRWALWRQGFNAAKEYWLLGRGHGSMHYIIKLSYLEGEGRWHAAGPHNYYIFVWGNSGLAALIALLGFWAYLLVMGMRCRQNRIRAGIVSVGTLFILLALSTHALFSMQFLGPVFAVIALTGHYGRERQGRVARFAPPASMPARLP